MTQPPTEATSVVSVELTVGTTGCKLSAPADVIARMTSITWDRETHTQAEAMFAAPQGAGPTEFQNVELIDFAKLEEGTETFIGEAPYAIVDNKTNSTEVARFRTLREAQAALVGLEYAWPGDVKDGRFAIKEPT